MFKENSEPQSTLEDRVWAQARLNVEYRYNQKSLISLGKKLMQALGQDNRMLLEYEALINENKRIKIETAYSLGLTDHTYAQQNAQQKHEIR